MTRHPVSISNNIRNNNKMDEQGTNTRFSSVNSFSQLPFIRPTTSTPEKQSVRLFGTNVHTEMSDHDNAAEDVMNNTATVMKTPSAAISNIMTSTDSIRKFECHYCCRLFPTSQALGGHQNAHKRERQHAKRAHLQSVMAAAQSQQYHHQLIGYPHHRVISSPFYMTSPVNARFYCGPGSLAQPINGSPLVGAWRGPMAQVLGEVRDRPMQLPLFREAEVAVGANYFGSVSFISSSDNPSSHTPSRGQFVKENVSLDLHL